jgi:uncharacterized heparinase superfamily protein
MDIADGACSNIRALLMPDNTLPAFSDSCYSLFSPDMSQDLELLGTLARRVLGLSHADVGGNDSYLIDNHYYFHSNDSCKIVIDIGSLGWSCNPGHGHADLASFVYYYKGRPLFVDSGTPEYGSSEMAMAYKQSCYHSTMTIGGESQALLWGPFRWGLLPRVVTRIAEATSAGLQLTVAYEGFRQLGSYCHTRQFHLHRQDLRIVDQVEGPAAQKISIHFIIAAGWRVTQLENGVLFIAADDEILLSWREACVPVVQIDAIDIFPSYGERQSGQRLTLSFGEQEMPFESVISITFKG